MPKRCATIDKTGELIMSKANSKYYTMQEMAGKVGVNKSKDSDSSNHLVLDGQTVSKTNYSKSEKKKTPEGSKKDSGVNYFIKNLNVYVA